MDERVEPCQCNILLHGKPTDSPCVPTACRRMDLEDQIRFFGGRAYWDSDLRTFVLFDKSKKTT